MIQHMYIIDDRSYKYINENYFLHARQIRLLIYMLRSDKIFKTGNWYLDITYTVNTCRVFYHCIKCYIDRASVLCYQ